MDSRCQLPVAIWPRRGGPSKRLCSISPRVNPPDFDQRVATDAVKAIAEIDRRVAVRRLENDRIDEPQSAALWIVFDVAVLVALELEAGIGKLGAENDWRAAG